MTYTMQEAAAALGCAPITVSRHVRAGRLKALRAPGYNGVVAVREASVRKLLADRARAQAESFDTATVADMLGCSRRHVQRLVQLGVLDRYPYTGRPLRVVPASVTRYLREGAAA